MIDACVASLVSVLRSLQRMGLRCLVRIVLGCTSLLFGGKRKTVVSIESGNGRIDDRRSPLAWRRAQKEARGLVCWHLAGPMLLRLVKTMIVARALVGRIAMIDSVDCSRAIVLNVD